MALVALGFPEARSTTRSTRGGRHRPATVTERSDRDLVAATLRLDAVVRRGLLWRGLLWRGLLRCRIGLYWNRGGDAPRRRARRTRTGRAALGADPARHGGRSRKTCPLAPSFALVALCAGVTATDCVVPPERLCVDQCPRHPRLILRELDGLESAVWNAQRWLPEALVAPGRKAET